MPEPILGLAHLFVEGVLKVAQGDGLVGQQHPLGVCDAIDTDV